MMAIAAVIGFSAGKGLRSSSFYYSDITEKLSCSSDHTLPCHLLPSTKNVINAKKSSNYSPSSVSNRKKQSVKAVKEHVNVEANHSDMEPWIQMFKQLQNESSNEEDSVEVLLLLQKSMLEKQWNLSAEKTLVDLPQHEKNSEKKKQITCSGTSAWRRRMDTRKRVLIPKISATASSASKRMRSVICPEQGQNRLKGYINGVVSQELLTHAEVVQLSKKIKLGLYLEEQKSRLRERLGCEPSDYQLAVSLKISRADLRSTLMECSLAREKLAMSNVRLVMSIAQRYDGAGTEMADLIQGGLIGLLRGIEKFDHSRGFKISTYVYWWIRQDEVNNLISSTFREREGDIIRMYYSLDNECLTWEDISRRIGLSRERVRQIGLVALEKLKHAARKRRLDAMLVKQ